VGSQSKIDLAYIAGFLDGDGSLMLQIKKRGDSRLGWRFMSTICFYQDSRHETPLFWIRKKLGIGYIARRNDGMTELRINGFKPVNEILKNIMPYVKFKKHQALALSKATALLVENKISELNRAKLERIINYILTIQSENYATKNKKSKSELETILGLTP